MLACNMRVSRYGHKYGASAFLYFPSLPPSKWPFGLGKVGWNPLSGPSHPPTSYHQLTVHSHPLKALHRNRNVWLIGLNLIPNYLAVPSGLWSACVLCLIFGYLNWLAIWLHFLLDPLVSLPGVYLDSGHSSWPRSASCIPSDLPRLGHPWPSMTEGQLESNAF